MGEAVRFVEVAPRDGSRNWPDPVSPEVKARRGRALPGAVAGRVVVLASGQSAFRPGQVLFVGGGVVVR